MMEDPSAGIQSYLQTHAFKGIGPETARKLAVPETYNIFEDLSRPAEEISDAYGINAATATLFEMAWAKTSKTRDIQIMLRQLGLGNAVVKQIRETLGSNVIEEILSNPYQLVRKIKYFTFEDAENIVTGLNLDLSSDQRIISLNFLYLWSLASASRPKPLCLGLTDFIIKGNLYLLQASETKSTHSLESSCKL